MLCLSDTDLVIKLAALDLIEEAFEAFNVTRKEVRVTPEIVPYLEGRAFAKHSHDVVNRALRFAKSLKLVPDVNQRDMAMLRAVIGIDYGEQVLFASTAAIKSDYLVATGDKTSLRALAKASACDHIRKRLKRRVVCLEQLVLGAIKTQGFEWVHKRAAPGCSCDECMVHAFANGTGRIDEPGCTKWLLSYVDKLDGEVGEMLHQPAWT